MISRILMGLISLAFIASCAKKTEFVVPEDREPKKKIEDSITVTNPIQTGFNDAQIAIQRQALGKEFLMSAQLIQLAGVPQFHGSKSRIVLFLEKHGSIYMLEASEGNIINNEIPARFVLAEFPIVQSTDKYVVFDFNTGMRQLYLAGDWRASDFDGDTRKHEKEFTSVDISSSYIETSEPTASNKLMIRQVAMVSERAGVNKNLSIESLFYISPYLPNPDFKPTLSRGFDRMGFFEVAPLVTDVETKKYATKFGTETYTYAISANTPDLYREAVRDGILYWNKAFGRERLKVVVAPEGINAPHPDYNIVQWVNWDTAGMAYADAQMDPRTGEILHSQVFQTSVFAVANKNRARKYLRGIKESSSHAEHKQIGLKGFSSKGLCNLDHQKAAKDLAMKILALDADEETALRLSRDAVREVVAHEIGHTLGLRHNFAGNLGAAFGANILDQYFKDYAEGMVPNAYHIPTSSVMDYLRTESAMLSGALVKSYPTAFSYDEMAIQYLYDGEISAQGTAPLYCTDSHRGKYIGCDFWDHGFSNVQDVKRKQVVAMSTWAQELVEKYISALTRPGSLKLTPSELPLDPKGDLTKALSYRGLLLRLVSPESKDLAVHRSYAKVDATNIRKIKEEQQEEWLTEVSLAGGLSKFLVRPSSSLVSELRSKTLRLLSSPQYRSGIGYDQKPYSLTDAQLEEIETALENYFAELERVLPEVDLETLGKPEEKLDNSELSENLADVFYERALRYLTTESGREIEGDIKVGDEKSIRVTLPEYKYEQALRSKAVELLTKRKSVEMDFAYDQKQSLKSVYEASLKSSLNDNDLGKVKIKESKGEARLWLLQNTALWTLFNGI